MYSNGPPHMADQEQDDQLEHTYSSSVRIRDVAMKTCQRRWMIGKSGEISVRDIRARGTTRWWWYIYIYILKFPDVVPRGFKDKFINFIQSTFINEFIIAKWRFVDSFHTHTHTHTHIYIYILFSCWNTTLRPSFWREEIMLCCSISQYMLEFMFLPTKFNSPTPAALMQPHTMTFPPPCLTVGMTHLSLYSSPGCRHTCLKPSEPNKLIFISSDHRT